MRPIPANDDSHGPFRKVVDIRFYNGAVIEELECGHIGRRVNYCGCGARLQESDGCPEHGWTTPAVGAKRRCNSCRYQLAQQAEADRREATVRVRAYMATDEGRAAETEAKNRRRAFQVFANPDH